MGLCSYESSERELVHWRVAGWQVCLRLCQNRAPACFSEIHSVPPFSVSGFAFQVASLKAQDGFCSDQRFRCFAQIQRLKNKSLSFELIGPPLNQSPWPGDKHMLIGFEWQFSEPVTLARGEVTIIGWGESRHIPRAPKEWISNQVWLLHGERWPGMAWPQETYCVYHIRIFCGWEGEKKKNSMFWARPCVRHWVRSLIIYSNPHSDFWDGCCYLYFTDKETSAQESLSRWPEARQLICIKAYLTDFICSWHSSQWPWSPILVQHNKYSLDSISLCVLGGVVFVLTFLLLLSFKSPVGYLECICIYMVKTQPRRKSRDYFFCFITVKHLPAVEVFTLCYQILP